jgi:hypothetical protein
MTHHVQNRVQTFRQADRELVHRRRTRCPRHTCQNIAAHLLTEDLLEAVYVCLHSERLQSISFIWIVWAALISTALHKTYSLFDVRAKGQFGGHFIRRALRNRAHIRLARESQADAPKTLISLKLFKVKEMCTVPHLYRTAGRARTALHHPWP